MFVELFECVVVRSLFVVVSAVVVLGCDGQYCVTCCVEEGTVSVLYFGTFRRWQVVGCTVVFAAVDLCLCVDGFQFQSECVE